MEGIDTKFVVDVWVVLRRVFACLVDEISRSGSDDDEEEEEREEEGVGRIHGFHENVFVLSVIVMFRSGFHEGVIKGAII